MDRDSIRACLTLAVQADGAMIETVEGPGSTGALSDLHPSFHDHHALQCGFCTPGFLMACTGLLCRLPPASGAEIRDAPSGNACRCTGHETIVNAVREAVQKRGPLA
jgi:carbon-monoxide dehydrogenase small subunit